MSAIFILILNINPYIKREENFILPDRSVSRSVENCETSWVRVLIYVSLLLSYGVKRAAMNILYNRTNYNIAREYITNLSDNATREVRRERWKRVVI